MVVRTKQPHQYPTLMYKEEPIQCVKSFKYLGIDIAATNRWGGCFESRLQAGKNYYMLENQCNQSYTRGWEVKLMLFNAMVTQVLLYGVEVLGGTISCNACYLGPRGNTPWTVTDRRVVVPEWMSHRVTPIACTRYVTKLRLHVVVATTHVLIRLRQTQ